MTHNRISGVFLRMLAILALVAGLGALPLVLTSCDDDTEETPNTGCTEDDGLEITAVTPSSGFNLEEHEVTLSGGCFDEETVAVLVDDEGGVTALAEDPVSEDELIVTIPAGIPVGGYTIRLTRDDLMDEGDYYAVSNIVVATGNEYMFYVVDLSDMDHPREFMRSEPRDADLGPAVIDATGTKIYYSLPIGDADYGIYQADLLDDGSQQLITPATPPLWGFPDASPTDDKLTLMGCGEVGNVCDIYVIPGDGGTAIMVADHEDVLIVNGEETHSGGYYQPVFSPDGSRIAFLSDNLGESGEYYTVILIMDADGSDKEVAYWETATRFYDFLNWTCSDYLIWSRKDSDQDPQEIWMLDVGEGEAVQVTAPGGGFGDFVWLVYSPIESEPGFILQPAYTAEMDYYPLTFGAGITAGAKEPVEVPNPESPGDYYEHYSQTEWFGWIY